MKPLIVGELNPYGSDPAFALYPLPPNASGGRLCHILGLSDAEYLRQFERRNLCTGTWSVKAARAEARVIAASRDYEAIILLGRSVCDAFGVQYEPFKRLGRYLMLPHPSGLCRSWNDPRSVPRARRLVRGVLRAAS